MELDKDTRGWIMTFLSGIACTLGASVICVDLLVQMIPGHRKFRIEDSNTFLSSSLSISFGVMLFSSLYSMLPSSKRYLEAGGFSSKAAAWTLICCFLGGVVGIQVLSRILHHYMPSHVVDCDHSHFEDEENKGSWEQEASRRKTSQCEQEEMSEMDEEDFADSSRPRVYGSSSDYTWDNAGQRQQPLARRTSLPSNFTSRFSKGDSDSKAPCTGDGRCYGFSDICGQECFQRVQARGGTKSASSRPRTRTPSYRWRTVSSSGDASAESRPLLRDSYESDTFIRHSDDQSDIGDANGRPHHSQVNGHVVANDPGSRKASMTASHGQHPDHHHHVPANAFLSIGLQTSLAIALHKLPEGFITYATNHASSKLGFAVFIALFIHNIGEGFAMALPLYLAIKSRPRAMLWSALLGGASQPLGAGIAALWFRLAGSGGNAEPGQGVYGAMFAVTAGVMTSVALQLFSESLDLTHNRTLCMAFSFVGMGVMGFSAALTA